jgi:hypothetical protein
MGERCEYANVEMLPVPISNIQWEPPRLETRMAVFQNHGEWTLPSLYWRLVAVQTKALKKVFDNCQRNWY